MNSGIWIAAGAVGVGTVAGLIIAKQNRKFFDNGAANKMRDYDFYMQANTFKTVVPDFDTFLTALDMSAIRQRGISISKDAAGERLIFRDAGGNMVATLSTFAADAVDGIRRFTFRLNSWKTHNNSIVPAARLNANIVLTAIEKAFLTLDYNAVVERVYLTDWKSETSFF